MATPRQHDDELSWARGPLAFLEDLQHGLSVLFCSAGTSKQVRKNLQNKPKDDGKSKPVPGVSTYSSSRPDVRLPEPLKGWTQEEQYTLSDALPGMQRRLQVANAAERRACMRELGQMLPGQRHDAAQVEECIKHIAKNGVSKFSSGSMRSVTQMGKSGKLRVH
eukprot:CAMPEP_0113688874 /NCGR_PEP_ID=MMETSP0038_2-20120614/16803_1 /TAXON_ID=2898 /ORGANISM="Cryptomonas paramecium" /LENGTH=163 /DNA_ID=CAMNT_0000609787 /DNA_START=100 /DNA_END=591 /DNA_ORIENTATION=+ /assembly_acc=CAM_ASM_000170